mmetsp:Transcript_32943/g.38342  ORF Transcript_32943/g.38342 Transcript_32943/m.38342 type:complete len:257 (-) Transcript_32943:213-983(-)
MSSNNKKRKSQNELEASSEETSTALTTPCPNLNNKKKKGLKTKSSSENGSSASDETSSLKFPESFEPYNLTKIKSSLIKLSHRIPDVPPEGIDPCDKEKVLTWATSMQASIEEFNLLLTCVSAATYKWGTDRTGAADQNLSLLSNELGNAQEQINASVTPRLTNVLAPVVELVTSETSIKKLKDEKTGEEYEKRINSFSREENDPGFIHLCHVILCRNAVMLRHVVLTNLFKVQKCIEDYLKATKKDGSGNRSGFY